MAAAWLMVERTGSSFLAALVQTAVFLPMFVLSLPAGVLADTTDRRRADAQPRWACRPRRWRCWPRCCCVGFAGPASLLLLTFVAGCCTALLSPAWNSAVGEIHAARRAAAGHHRDEHRLQRRARARPGAGRRGVRAGRQPRVDSFVGAVLQRAGDAAGGAALAAEAAPASAPAGRAAVGRHADRPALCAPLATHPGATGAHRGLQRGRLGAVGAAAGHRPAQLGLGAARASAC